jgi:16S rRNA (cytosine967-C5)-methyltransferase
LSDNPRQFAFQTLRSIQRGAFADVAVDKALQRSQLSSLDKALFTELVYGCVRRQRTLDALIDQLGKKKSHQQPPDLRLILHLGLYQLRYLNHIPPSAAVNTAVELAKQNGFAGLAGVLRRYGRSQLVWEDGGDRDGQEGREDAGEGCSVEPLQLPTDPVQRLGILHSYPDWIVQIWLEQFGFEETEQLCQWMNQPPAIALRVNPLKATVEQVEAAMTAAGVAVKRLPLLPQALQLVEHQGAIQELPGFQEGWWMVQDGGAQLVSHVLDPQPGETVIDACAAPGGKSIHIAELMQDQGVIWACDRTESRLRKLQQNCDRLGIHAIRIHLGDSRSIPEFVNGGDRVLLDAPCSGLGTLHRHADARWRQSPASIQDLVSLQMELLAQAAIWVKPGGTLVYATCTLHPAENEQQIQAFLNSHPDWSLLPPTPDSLATPFAAPQGWLKVLPHHWGMDGFFMARLERKHG